MNFNMSSGTPEKAKISEETQTMLDEYEELLDKYINLRKYKDEKGDTFSNLQLKIYDHLSECVFQELEALSDLLDIENVKHEIPSKVRLNYEVNLIDWENDEAEDTDFF